MTPVEAFDAVGVGSEIQRRVGVKTSRDEPLARFTTMRVGGPADLFATVHNPFELRALVRFARQRQLPHFVLGRGSDLVVSDRGIRGLVIQDRAEGSRLDGDRYTADAGVPMARAATETQKAGLTGLEFGLAIPGTVGGAVWANAGAHDADVAGILVSARVVDAAGSEAVVPAADLALAYRDSRFKHASGDGPPELILDATFQLTPADPDEAAGLKGHRIGGAVVSEKHANFIVNDQKGTAADVRRVGDHVRETVAKQTGVELVYEVEFVGDWEGWPWPA